MIRVHRGGVGHPAPYSSGVAMYLHMAPLFPTLARFDAVYYNHFKTNKKRLIDYPNLWGYTRELYQIPGVAETVNMDHIKYHYFASHRSINPTGIVPKGPELNFMQAHERDSLSKR